MKTNVAVGRAEAMVALLLAGLSGACTNSHEPAAEESRAKQVLDAQYAARSEPQPMQASEADRIYENYLENIGKPLENKGTSGSSRR